MKNLITRNDLNNKNSTYEEYKAAIYGILMDEYFPKDEEDVQRVMEQEKETIRHGYENGYYTDDRAWGLSLLLE